MPTKEVVLGSTPRARCLMRKHVTGKHKMCGTTLAIMLSEHTKEGLPEQKVWPQAYHVASYKMSRKLVSFAGLFGNVV
jgi:hypothetical protein